MARKAKKSASLSSVELEQARRVLEFLAAPRGEATPKLVDETGETVPVPVTLLRTLQKAAEEVSRGNDVAVFPLHQELTTTQAAEILSVSRPYVAKLVDAGEIPSHHVGTHRRVQLGDLLKYKKQRDSSRRKVLRRLTRDAQEHGLDF